MAAENALTQSSNIQKFNISSNQQNKAVDLTGGVVEFRYYESVLSNVTTCSMVLAETGYEMSGNDTVASEGLLDGLPIRGGERVDISIEDNFIIPNNFNKRFGSYFTTLYYTTCNF